MVEIDARLQTLRPDPAIETAKDGAKATSGAGFGMRVGTEMVSAVLVGFGLGYALDNWLNTKPGFMMGGLLLGAVTGFVNVYRVVKGLDDAVGLGRAIEAKAEADRQKAEAKRTDDQ